MRQMSNIECVTLFEQIAVITIDIREGILNTIRYYEKFILI